MWKYRRLEAKNENLWGEELRQERGEGGCCSAFRITFFKCLPQLAPSTAVPFKLKDEQHHLLHTETKIFNSVIKFKIPNIICKSHGAHCRKGERTHLISQRVDANTSCSVCLLEVVHLHGWHLFNIVFTKPDFSSGNCVVEFVYWVCALSKMQRWKRTFSPWHLWQPTYW